MENPSVYQITQVGVETTAGTAVAATKRLTSLALTPTIESDVKIYKPVGYRLATVGALSKEWSGFKLAGPVTYNEIMYVFNSLIKAVTPTGAGANKTSVFALNSTGGDTRKTYTIEHGTSDRARQTAYGLVTGLEVKFNRDEVTCSGSVMGKAITDAFTLTTLTSAAEIAVVPVLPTQGSVKLADTQSGLAGATAAARVFEVTWKLDNLSGPVWPINSSTSFAALVDTAPTAGGSVKMAVDAEGMALLANLRAGSTKFMRVNYVGDALGTGNYQFQIDVALKVKSVKEFADEAGVYAVGWDWEMVHDSTWGKGTEITVVNALTSL